MDKLTTLWQGANYQDNLLQAYRSFHLTIQSILIAIGAGLSIATLTIDYNLNKIFSYLLLCVISVLGIYLLLTMRKLINARAEDVDYFHNQIIEFENSCPPDQQVLTSFKIFQKFNRNKTNINEYFKIYELTDITRKELTEKGKGHTRQLLDKYLFFGFYIVWISFHFVSLWTVLKHLG